MDAEAQRRAEEIRTIREEFLGGELCAEYDPGCFQCIVQVLIAEIDAIAQAVRERDESIRVLTEDREKWFNRCEFELEPEIARLTQALAEKDFQLKTLATDSGKAADALKEAEVEEERLTAALAEAHAAIERLA